MKDLIIIGVGGFGREVAWLANHATETYQILGFLDDREPDHATDLGGLPYLGPIKKWKNFHNALFAIAVGAPRVRLHIAQKMAAQGIVKYATLIHQSCLIGPCCQIEPGTMICAGCILTTSITVGKHCILNLNTTVGHDVSMGSFVTVAPLVAISGNVTIADGAEIGSGSCIRQGLTIGTGTMLGMGSVLTKNIPDNTMFFGSPAVYKRSLDDFYKHDGRTPAPAIT